MSLASAAQRKLRLVVFVVLQQPANLRQNGGDGGGDLAMNSNALNV